MRTHQGRAGDTNARAELPAVPLADRPPHRTARPSRITDQADPRFRHPHACRGRSAPPPRPYLLTSRCTKCSVCRNS